MIKFIKKVLAIFRYPSVPAEDKRVFLIWYRSQFEREEKYIGVSTLAELREKYRAEKNLRDQEETPKT